MDENKKHFDDYQQFLQVGFDLLKFSGVHNTIKDDYSLLIEITEKSKSNSQEFNSLYRSCVKSLFSLMEADIYFFNMIDQYEDYSDADHFIDKLKSTFKQVCTTFGKLDIQKKYFDTKIADLRKIRNLRDELMHPKSMEHIHEANEKSFQMLKDCFNDYVDFINKLMTNFFIKTTIPFDNLL